MVRPLAGKKAQITVFMIVGIILLFSSAILFYIRAQVQTQQAEEMIPALEEVPLEAQPIKLYVEECLQKIGKKAVEQIGLHGGYVEPLDPDISGRSFVMAMRPTESDGLTMLDEKSIVPYWWYMKSPNNCKSCQLKSQRPPLRKTEGAGSIEEQLDKYVEKELNSCLKNFSVFAEQGYTFNNDILDSDAMVTEKDVVLYLEMPLKIERGGKVTAIEQFYTRLDVPLKEVYAMATEITNNEINSSFLEKSTMNAIAMYASPKSMDRLPPISDSSLDPSEFLIWTTTATQQKLEQYVLPNTIASLQVDQSAGAERHFVFDAETLKYDRIGTALLDKQILVIPTNYTRFAAEFTYLDWWPIYLDISHREVLKADSVSIPLLSWIVPQVYRFAYSVSFPVLVEITAPGAYNGEGYRFMFALETNIKYNSPIPMNATMLDVEEGTLICSENQKVGPESRFEVKDAINGSAIPNVQLMLVFGTEGCHVGNTELDADNKTIITSRLPAGLGEIRAMNPNYVEYSERFFSSAKRGVNKTVELMPFYYMNVSVFAKQLMYVRNGKYALPAGAPTSPMNRDEKYVIIFTRMDNDTHSGFTTMAGGEWINTTILKIIPGTYQVEGFIFTNTSFSIPAETFKIDGGIFGGDKEIPFNKTDFTSWQRGGIVMNNETGYFKIEQNQLMSSKKLNMYMLRFPTPTTHMSEFKDAPGLDQVAGLDIYSSNYRPELQPEWIR